MFGIPFYGCRLFPSRAHQGHRDRCSCCASCGRRTSSATARTIWWGRPQRGHPQYSPCCAPRTWLQLQDRVCSSGPQGYVECGCNCSICGGVAVRRCLTSLCCSRVFCCFPIGPATPTPDSLSHCISEGPCAATHIGRIRIHYTEADDLFSTTTTLLTTRPLDETTRRSNHGH